jgi:hypothetical protein
MTVITRYRGDTAGDDFYIGDVDGSVLDLTSYTARLTVNKRYDPKPGDAPLFSIQGIAYSVSEGLFVFPFNEAQADQEPGTYYYDVQIMDGFGNIRTAVKDLYIFVQDITK